MQLLEHLKELSIHPKNAEELKGLILQLAVQGKLTVKWRAENPTVKIAVELFDEIQKEKEILVSNKVYKAKYDTDKFEPLIKRPEIPDTWKYVTIGNICELMTGATPSKAKSQFFGGDIKWLVSGDIHKGYIHDCEGRITELGMESSNCKILPVDSIMIALNGQGKTRATVALLKTKATCNQSLVAMKPFLDNCDLSEYIYYLLKGKYYQIRDITGQKQRRGLNMTLVSQLPVALPPLEEQKAIVEVVNQLFTEVKQLEDLTKERISIKEEFAASALRRLTQADDVTQEWNFLQQHFSSFFTEKSNIKKLRETIMQLAVQGKLTAHWRIANPSLEPASELLKRIEAEKQQLIKEKRIKKEKPLLPIEDKDKPFELPYGWAWCRLNKLTEVITKGSSPKWQGVQYVEENEGGILFVTSENVGSYKLLLDKRKYVELKFNEIEPRSILKRNDILMNIVGGSIGRTAIYDIDDLANINQAVTIIRLLHDCNYGYFLHFFNSPVCISYMYDKQVDNARPNLSMGSIAKFIMPLPPLEEQKAIVEKVNSLMALCDELAQEIDNSQTQIEQLMHSCLREVFEGKKEVEL
jgi:type I restriction enzyme, S subunit